MKFKYSLIVVLLGINALAWGQTACPGGVPAGDPRCGPSPSWHGVTANPAPSTPQPRWATRWGAVAIDDTVINGGIGTVVGMSSKRKAEKAALAQCRATGGASCKIMSTYNNGCGVIAWGDKSLSTAHAPTIEEASKSAVLACSKRTSNCSVYYADCSLPERIQ